MKREPDDIGRTDGDPLRVLGRASEQRSRRTFMRDAAIGTGTLALSVPLTALAGAQEEPTVQFFDFGERDGEEKFQQAVDDRGYDSTSMEDFEDAQIGNILFGGPDSVHIDDPLDADTDNSVFDAGDIPEALRFQSNRQPGGEAGPDPVGTDGLTVERLGTRNNTPGDYGLSAARDTDDNGEGDGGSIDVLSLNGGDHAFRFKTYEDGEVFGDSAESIQKDVRVFDDAGNLIGSRDAETFGSVDGVVVDEDVTIGRINLTGVNTATAEIDEGGEFDGRVIIDEIETFGTGTPEDDGGGGLLGWLFG